MTVGEVDSRYSFIQSMLDHGASIGLEEILPFTRRVAFVGKVPQFHGKKGRDVFGISQEAVENVNFGPDLDIGDEFRGSRFLEDRERDHRRSFYRMDETGYDPKAFEEDSAQSPSVISRELSAADVVFTPPEMVDRLKSKLPGLHLMVRDEAGTYEGPLPSIQYPVLEKKARVDRETVRQLMNSQLRKDNDRLLDPSFYGHLNHTDFRSGIERTTFKVWNPEREFYNAFSRWTHQEGHWTTGVRNGYMMGDGQAGQTFNRHGSDEKYIEWRDNQLRSTLEILWSKPVSSVEVAEARLDVYVELLENADLRRGLYDLSKNIVKLREPYMHLTSMAQLFTANTLGSKWGGTLHQKSFHHDFMNIADLLFEPLTAIMSQPIESENLDSLLGPIDDMVEGESVTGLRRLYDFLLDLKQSPPRNYSDLRAMLLGHMQGASLDPDLENYVAFKEECAHGRGMHLAMDDWGREYYTSLDGQKSNALGSLLERFQAQNPVSAAYAAMDYLEYVGILVEAFVAKTEFMVSTTTDKLKWVRPKYAPDGEGIIDIRQGWYPLMKKQHGDHQPNDSYFDQDHRLEMIDGVNVGGKSVDTRKLGFIGLGVLTGSPVPAESVTMSMIDYIRYRIKDTGMSEHGALVKELSDLSAELEVIDDDRSVLAMYDEFGTSTNPIEGEGLLYATAIRFSQRPNVRAVFTSHYPSMHDILDDPDGSGIFFSSFDYDVDGSKIIFDHVKKNHPNTRGDYAIDIAESEGVPKSIIAHARSYDARFR